MSTVKTGRLSIPLLAGLLAIVTACAPTSPPPRLAPPPPPPKAAAAPTALDVAKVVPPPAEDATTPVEAITTEDNNELPEENTASEPEQTASQEVQELAGIDNNWEEGSAATQATDQPAITYDFPVTVNRQVEFYLNFFQNSQHDIFARWLARSGRYLPMIRQELQAAGLPSDLAYLPMIESGYNLTAYSTAGAAGPWQFMQSTASRYGLTVNQYVDERRDPIKSTKAAISYLKRLYDEFNSWQLAVAAYNAGEGRIRQAIRSKGTNNFWKLAQERGALNLETKRYVPKLIAAILIAKDPAKYGFAGVQAEPPFDFTTVDAPPRTSLAAVAVALGVSVEELRDLNRQLRKAVTPPSRSPYPLKVPTSKALLFARNMPRVHATVNTHFKTHVVARHETLSRICRVYNINKSTLLKANGLRRSKLKTGQRLRIPYQTTTYTLLNTNQIASLSKQPAMTAKNLLLHTVRPGETISQLAKRYNVTPQLIAAWNGLKDVNAIRAGQQLALYLDEATRKLATQAAPAPAAQPVETAAAQPVEAALAQPVEAASAQPELSTDPQSSVAMIDPATDPPGHLTYYQVQGGDTLWTIAKKYNLTPEEIRRWNNLDGDVIHPGARLLLKIHDDLDV